ncbi:unnamed protein product [Eruca vesicaria subsp. sativa]|uniref:Uncharacterized protein n=1 Tax=Eruca vesicaria subsp. sativa TaxID=29727 RepID=A0ABC8L8C4_ERUVS|nr:unnamed protein product [Eruca vesicaria subsp. sativa]
MVLPRLPKLANRNLILDLSNGFQGKFQRNEGESRTTRSLHRLRPTRVVSDIKKALDINERWRDRDTTNRICRDREEAQNRKKKPGIAYRKAARLRMRQETALLAYTSKHLQFLALGKDVEPATDRVSDPVFPPCFQLSPRLPPIWSAWVRLDQMTSTKI